MFNYINAYALYPVTEKYLGRKILAKKDQLKKEDSFSLEQHKAQSQKDLHKILSEAKENVEYYSDLFKSINFDPDSVLVDIKYINELPFLAKEDLLEHENRLINKKCHKHDLIRSKTAGSTGATANIYYSQDAADWAAAVHLHVMDMTGKKRTDSEVHLSTNFQRPKSYKERLVENIKCLALNRTNVYTSSFNDSDLRKLYQQLKAATPYLIQGHPSTLYALALYLHKHAIDASGLFSSFESSGEKLDLKKQQIIEKTFKAKIFNRYGSAEFGVMAHSIDDPFSLQLFHSVGYYENYELGNGLQELVVTSLKNHAMPLIRYKTGDIAQIINNKGTEYLVNLQGRVHDTIEIDHKIYPTHYIQDILQREGGVYEFQIVRAKTPTIRIIPEKNEPQANIEKKVRDYFGNRINIEFINPSQLKLQGWREKFRYII